MFGTFANSFSASFSHSRTVGGNDDENALATTKDEEDVALLLFVADVKTFQTIAVVDEARLLLLEARRLITIVVAVMVDVDVAAVVVFELL